jgi:hypothetical protein
MSIQRQACSGTDAKWTRLNWAPARQAHWAGALEWRPQLTPGRPGPLRNVPDRLDQEIERLRTDADKLPPGTYEREMALSKVRQPETASHMNE